MYRYTITDDIVTDLDRIEQLRASLDAAGPLPRIWRGRLRRDLEAEAVAASTIMEGVAVTVDEARRILAGDRPAGVVEQDAGVVDGYRDAMHLVLARADDPSFSFQSELLLAIHHRVLGGSFASGAGRFRSNQNWLTNRGTGGQVYLPPDAASVPLLVDEMTAWLNAADEPGPVAAALAHIALAGIHPYSDGNGRVARILASLVMYRSGFRAPQFTSLEEWWGRHIDEYYRAFDCLGTEWNPAADVTPFVESHVRAQATQAEALSLRNATERALWTVLEDIVVHDLGLHERVTNALYDAFFARAVTNRYYRGVSEISEVTASHDLGKLVAAGVLVARGAGRSTHYESTSRLYESVVAGADLDERWLSPGTPAVEQRDVALTGLAAMMHGVSTRA